MEDTACRLRLFHLGSVLCDGDKCAYRLRPFQISKELSGIFAGCTAVGTARDSGCRLLNFIHQACPSDPYTCDAGQSTGTISSCNRIVCRRVMRLCTCYL